MAPCWSNQEVFVNFRKFVIIRRNWAVTFEEKLHNLLCGGARTCLGDWGYKHWLFCVQQNEV